VIDFAYAVPLPTVGNSEVGCKINGKFATLVRTNCRNGDEVEVLTSKSIGAATIGSWEVIWFGFAVDRQGRALRSAAANRNSGARLNIAGLRPAASSNPTVRRAPRIRNIPTTSGRGALPRAGFGTSIEEVMASVGARRAGRASRRRRVAMIPDYRERSGWLAVWRKGKKSRGQN